MRSFASNAALLAADVGGTKILLGLFAAAEPRPQVIAVREYETAAFRGFVSNNPGFAWALLEHLSGGMRAMTDRVYEFSTLVVRKRLIRELLRRAQGRDPGRQARRTADE